MSRTTHQRATGRAGGAGRRGDGLGARRGLKRGWQACRGGFGELVCSSPAGGAAELPAAGDAETIVGDGETILLALQPSLWFVPLSCLGSLAAIACAVLAMAWATRFPSVPWTDGQAFFLGAVLTGGRLAWQLFEWSQRLYVLTDRRVFRRRRAWRPMVEHLALKEVRHAVVLATARERWLGVGTVCFTAAGELGLSWELVRRPHEALRIVREAVERYG